MKSHHQQIVDQAYYTSSDFAIINVYKQDCKALQVSVAKYAKYGTIGMLSNQVNYIYALFTVIRLLYAVMLG